MGHVWVPRRSGFAVHGATAAPALSTRSARPAGGDHGIDIERVRVSVKAHLYSNRTTQRREHDALHERGCPPVFAGHLEGPQANLSPCLVSDRDPRPHSTSPGRSRWATPSFMTS